MLPARPGPGRDGAGRHPAAVHPGAGSDRRRGAGRRHRPAGRRRRRRRRRPGLPPDDYDELAAAARPARRRAGGHPQGDRPGLAAPRPPDRHHRPQHLAPPLRRPRPRREVQPHGRRPAQRAPSSPSTPTATPRSSTRSTSASSATWADVVPALVAGCAPVWRKRRLPGSWPHRSSPTAACRSAVEADPGATVRVAGRGGRGERRGRAAHPVRHRRRRRRRRGNRAIILVDWGGAGRRAARRAASPATGRVIKEEPGFAGAVPAMVEVADQAAGKERRARLPGGRQRPRPPASRRFCPATLIALLVSRTNPERGAAGRLGCGHAPLRRPHLAGGGGRRGARRPDGLSGPRRRLQAALAEALKNGGGRGI